MNKKFTYTPKEDSYNQIYEIVATYDPQGIAFMEDEYESEVNDIHNRFLCVCDEEDMLYMVYGVFKYWFEMVGEVFEPIEDYKDMSHELWLLLNKNLEQEN